MTWNERDFPKEVLDPFDIEVQTPDEFVLNQIMLEKVGALAAIKRMRERWRALVGRNSETCSFSEIRWLSWSSPDTPMLR